MNQHSPTRARIFLVALLSTVAIGLCAQSPEVFRETFEEFDSTRFRTKIPNQNTEVRDGALWTRGKSGGKYPPMVYLDVAGKDLEISFRYRHLQKGGMVWFFVDGDDGFGSVDHMLRVKLLRAGVQLQIDAHSLDPNHPDRQNNNRPADKVSGAYRLNEKFPQESVDLSANVWRKVRLSFNGDTVSISVDGRAWSKTLKHACFNAAKRKLLWMQNGGAKGVEIDDILIRESTAPTWSLGNSGVTNSIRGISAVDAKVCWFGTKTGVARTTDGGKNWMFTKIGGDELDFRDLHALDSKRCIAMSAGTGRASRIYLTSDGGKTWKLTHQNTEAKGFFNGFDFRDEQHGILAGDAVDGRLFLLATDDGGSSWHRVAKDTAPRMPEGEHAFAASGTHLTVNEAGHVWVASGGKVARVFHSPDWGKTWEAFDTPMISGEPSTGIFSISFQGTSGIAVGGDYKKESEGIDNLIRSTNGGESWQLDTKKKETAPFPFRSCIGHVDAKTLIAVGPSGTDISRDGGLTWQALPGNGGFHTFSIAANTVWAAGANGRVGYLRLSGGSER